MSENRDQPDLWMGRVLRAAGIYNLAWGSWVIFFPTSSLQICGYAEPVTYPELWQCIGMIVGVYGIGYWIAASDPFRHWPIILVGLLGKVLGPIGFAYSWLAGRLPASAGLVNIFNDLIWWIPFTVILWRALRYETVRKTSGTHALSFPDAIRSFRSQNGETLAELSLGERVLVLFLRHSGCTFCREALAEIETLRPDLEKSGVRIAFVHMATEEEGRSLFERYHVDDLPRFSDPQQILYQAFEIGIGRFQQLMSWQVLRRGFQSAIVKGHGFARVRNNVFRMPGTFLLEDGKITDRYISKNAADHPDYAQFACPLPNVSASDTMPE